MRLCKRSAPLSGRGALLQVACACVAKMLLQPNTPSIFQDEFLCRNRSFTRARHTHACAVGVAFFFCFSNYLRLLFTEPTPRGALARRVLSLPG